MNLIPPGARPSNIPIDITPHLAPSSTTAPEGNEWLHEIKFDGYRMICHIDGDKVRFNTRSGLDWTDRVEPLVHAIQKLALQQAILDGEVVVLAPNGTTSFEALQRSLGRHSGKNTLYYVFDILFLDGFDLRGVELQHRKSVLAELLEHAKSERIRYVDHIVGNGPAVFLQACRLGVEGIISKRLDRPHRPGRTTDWWKIKCLHTQEFVVGGFTDPEGARVGFGALVLGHFDSKGHLIYVGRVGTGFSEQILEELRNGLSSIERTTSPFAELPDKERRSRGMHWVEPQLVVQVEFLGWSDDRHLRHASFRGLREDKPARDVLCEEPHGG
jgi:bifunctional non-homologous end joining protein LigD